MHRDMIEGVWLYCTKTKIRCMDFFGSSIPRTEINLCLSTHEVASKLSTEIFLYYSVTYVMLLNVTPSSFGTKYNFFIC